MRKRVFGKKLNRPRRSRVALFRSQARALILHGRIKTTKAKAQALRPELERLMTLVKKGELSSQRAALARLGNDKEAVNLLFSKYTELVRSRNSGFVKIQLLAQRRGDAAEMVEISWVNFEDKDENVSNKTKRS